ncbi:MAG TPA: tagaturonate epimerase family protein [Haploplasma sp.]|nr:tagaturonate epimerase family protein [Haploplasma sp.]
MSKINNFLDTLPNPNSFNEFDIYEKSLNKVNNDFIFVAKLSDGDHFVVTGELSNKFEGKKELHNNFNYVVALPNYNNMKLLRELFPFTKPVPVLREKRSFGLGDRLGLAGEGHLLALEKYDAYPILAQQSMRELSLTNRNYQDVLDAASLAVFKMGYTRGFGADGDHLKTAKDIKYAIDTGFTMITLDTSDYIKNDVNSMSDEEVLNAVELTNYEKDLYLNKTFNVGSYDLTFNEVDLKRAVLIYRDSINYATKIYEEFFKNNNNVDFELSIDETATPTELVQHFYIANELKNNGVVLTTIAPRFHGEFQKGIDYIGDIDLFERELKVHVAIAEQFGYKLSIHSGSDKFSIFEIIGKETAGHFHVKTAGTNWLEAVNVVAVEDPKLYRKLHAYALASFEDAKKLYHVTTNLNNIPNLDTLTDEELPLLFKEDDARQLIHITYGHILTATNKDGTSMFKDTLYNLWNKYSDTYANMLESHIGRHLELLYKGFNN